MTPDQPTATATDYKTPLSKLASSRAWKLRNKSRLEAYDKKRNAEIRSNPDAWVKKLALNRESAKRNYAKWLEYDRKRDVLKIAARNAVRHEIEEGRMARGCCAVCGQQNAHAHHSDYAKPLEVIWLCPTHHKEVHKNEHK